MVSWGKLKLAQTQSARDKSRSEKSIKLVPGTFVHCHWEHTLFHPQKASTDLFGIIRTFQSMFFTFGRFRSNPERVDRGTKHHKYGMSGSCWQKSINHSVKAFYDEQSLWLILGRLKTLEIPWHRFEVLVFVAELHKQPILVSESDIKNPRLFPRMTASFWWYRKFMQRHLSISVVGKHLFPSGVKNFPGSRGFDLKRPKVKKHGSGVQKIPIQSV